MSLDYATLPIKEHYLYGGQMLNDVALLTKLFIFYDTGLITVGTYDKVGETELGKN